MTCPQQSGGLLDLGDKQGDCATGLWTGHIGRDCRTGACPHFNIVNH